MIIFCLLFINFASIVTMYYLNDTISNLQKENSKLIGMIQNLNHEIQYLEKLEAPLAVPEDPNTQLLFGFLGILTITLLGITFLILLKNETQIMGELSKNSIQATGDYVKEIIVPSVELLNKSSEARILANLDNVKHVVTETGSVLTTHITEVNREGVLCVLNTVKPPVSTKVLGSISRELLNLIP